MASVCWEQVAKVVADYPFYNFKKIAGTCCIDYSRVELYSTAPCMIINFLHYTPFCTDPHNLNSSVHIPGRTLLWFHKH